MYVKTQMQFAIGEVYHIYNRGVDKRQVFMDKHDYLRFYELLYFFNTKEPSFSLRHARMDVYSDEEVLVKIHAYSLLGNHYHLLIEQVVDEGISLFMKKIGGGYTNYFNNKYDRSGSLFQGKFKRVHIKTDEKYNYLLAYVNENHTIHNKKYPEEIMYSSSLHYRKKAKSRLITEMFSENYDYIENKKLAIDIYKNRKLFKNEILE